MNKVVGRRSVHVTVLLTLSGVMACGSINTPSTAVEQTEADSDAVEQLLADIDSVQAEALEPRVELLAARHSLDASQVSGLIVAYREATRLGLRGLLAGETVPRKAPFDLTATAAQVGIPTPIAADILLWFELLTERCNCGE